MNNENVEIKLGVNASEAEKELTGLQKKADELRKALERASSIGDTKSIKTLQKDLSATKWQMTQMQSSAQNVEDVMRRLNKVAPNELRRTLRSLNQELNKMECNSKAWDEQTAKIRKLKAELNSIKKDISDNSSLLDKFRTFLSEWANGLNIVFEKIGQIVSTARQFVQSYADMDAAMANTRKFTGMTHEEVDSLNEEFKKMDTRSSREQLNELAQSAGRLGKTTQEEVLGFVRAGGIPALPGPCLSRLLKATRA